MARCRHCDRYIQYNATRSWEHQGYRVFCANGDTRGEPK